MASRSGYAASPVSTGIRSPKEILIPTALLAAADAGAQPRRLIIDDEPAGVPITPITPPTAANLPGPVAAGPVAAAVSLRTIQRDCKELVDILLNFSKNKGVKRAAMALAGMVECKRDALLVEIVQGAGLTTNKEQTAKDHIIASLSTALAVTKKSGGQRKDLKIARNAALAMAVGKYPYPLSAGSSVTGYCRILICSMAWECACGSGCMIA